MEQRSDGDNFPWELVREFSLKYKSIRLVSVALCGTSKTTTTNNRMKGMRTTMSLPLYNRNGYRNSNNNNSASEQYHFTKDILIKIVPIEDGAGEQSLYGTTKYGTIQGRNNRNKMYSMNNVTAEEMMSMEKMKKTGAVFNGGNEMTMENKLLENLFEGTTPQKRRQLIVLDMSCGNDSLLILEIVSLLFFVFVFLIFGGIRFLRCLNTWGNCWLYYFFLFNARNLFCLHWSFDNWII